MRRIDPCDIVKVAEKTYLESLLIGVSVNITSTQQLVPISIKCMLRGNSQVRIQAGSFILLFFS